MEALLWPEIRKEEVTLFEESNDESARYYVLTVLRGGYQTEILRKIWFDRADLHFVRLESFGPKGVLLSDVRYANWQPVDNPSVHRRRNIPRSIRIDRPHDEYRLDLNVTKITLNEPLTPDRFQLQPPAGAEVVHLADASRGQKAMMGHFVLRNLFHRPLRTLIGVLAIAVEVMLVVMIVGLTSGMLQETAKRIEGIGADIMVQAPAAQILIGFSGSPMPIKIADKIAELKYVQAVAPALLQFNSSGGVDVVYGIDPRIFRAVSGGFVFLAGHDMEGPDDLLVDDWAAKAKTSKVGDTFNLLNHDWNVAGIVEHGKGARLFVPITTLQDLVGARDKASIFLVKCTHPDHTEDVMDEIKDLLPNHPVRPLKDFMTLMTSTNIPGLQTFINAMIALAVAIGLLVIFLTMYTTVLERTRDIGVLKSLGASKILIVRALLTETVPLVFARHCRGRRTELPCPRGFLAIFPDAFDFDYTGMDPAGRRSSH